MVANLLSLAYRTRVALLLGSVLCASAGRAQACGEAFHRLAYTNQVATGAGDAVHPDRQPPCHGPNCSNAPSQNLPAVPVAPTAPGSQVKELVRPPLPASGTDSAAASFDRDITSPRATSRARSIFHPPRLG